ncbi:MAG: hypothetical protein ACLR23_03665 [Clostridia bacterium]
MHAGEANNSIGQRALGGNFHAATVKTIRTAEIQNEICTPARRTMATASGHSEAIFSAATVETITTAEIQNKICTPARRTIASASGHTKTNSSPPPSKRPYRRRYKMKYARR